MPEPDATVLDPHSHGVVAWDSSLAPACFQGCQESGIEQTFVGVASCIPSSDFIVFVLKVSWDLICSSSSYRANPLHP